VSAITDDIVTPDRRHWFFRHSLIVRITHWINVLCLTVLLMSGLQIFNANPQLDWGKQTNFSAPFIEIGATGLNGDNPRGFTALLGHRLDTTGVLGLSRNVSGEWDDRAFPSWITLPSTQNLAQGRRWHFFFAWLFVINGLIYLGYGLASGRLPRRLFPTGHDIRDIPHAIKEHALLRFPKGEESKRYNVLQKLAYLAVIFLLLPGIVLAGWTMSPGLNAEWPFLLDLFGGRQGARTFHFIFAWGIVLFVLIHVAMVILSGLWNNIRSMITGWYVIEEESAR
jgi:thiosulfate reductase cytochrome b subunit